MKKLIALVLVLVYALGLVSCNNSKNQSGNEESNDCIKVWSMGADYEADTEQSNTYRIIWGNLDWTEGADPTRYNYIFFDGDTSIYYDSGEGIFYDMTNKRHATLSEEMNTEVRNSINNLTFIQSHGDVVD